MAPQNYHYNRFDGPGGPYPYTAPYPYGNPQNQSMSNEWGQSFEPMQPSAKRVETPQEDDIDVDDDGSRQLMILGGQEPSAPSGPHFSGPSTEPYQHQVPNEPEGSPLRDGHHHQRGGQQMQTDATLPKSVNEGSNRRREEANGSASSGSASSGSASSGSAISSNGNASFIFSLITLNE